MFLNTLYLKRLCTRYTLLRSSDQSDSGSYTRREFLSGSAAIAIASVPLSGALSPRVELHEFNNGVALSVNDIERWRIDTALFGGSPRVRVITAGRNCIRLNLRNAHYPGTLVPADFDIELLKVLTGWNLDLQFLGSAAHISTDLERWLEGDTIAFDVVRPGLISRIGATGEMRVIGAASVTLRPDWRLDFGRRTGIRFSGFGTELSGSGLSLALLPPGQPGALSGEMPKTVLHARRGRNEWNLPGQELAQHSKLWRTGQPFDSVAIEQLEAENRAEAALVFRSESSSGRIGINLADELRSRDGNTIKPLLRDPVYAIGVAGEDSESLFLANLDQDIQVHGEAFSAVLQNPGTEPAIQIAAQNGTITQQAAVAEVGSVTTPELEGAIATFKVPHSARMPLFWDTVPYAVPDGLHTIGRGFESLFCWLGACKKARLCLDEAAISLLRAQDLLAIDFRFKNLSLSTKNGKAFLVRSQPGDSPLNTAGKAACPSDPQSPALLIVEFPGQNIAEQCFLEVAPAAGKSCGNVDTEQPHQPVETLLSGRSQLVFHIPDNLLAGHRVPFTVSSLLGWDKFTPVLPDNAQPPDSIFPPERAQCPAPNLREPQAPTPEQTQIEFPYRLIIAPHCQSRWLHTDSLPQVQKTPRAELWHTSLGALKINKDKPPRIDINDSRLRTIRAIWASDYKFDKNPDEDPCGPPGPAPTLRLPMNQYDRAQIVRLSSDYTITDLGPDGKSAPYEPAPVSVQHMALSSLGAWFDGVGQWELPRDPKNDKFSVEGWTHRASQGRDHFVKVIYRSYLMPFGHRVSVIKESQRFFYCGDEPVDSELKANVCYLRQKFYIVVREPVKTYPATGQPYAGRHLPFQRVEIRTLVTPALDDPCDKNGGGWISGLNAFWPFVGKEPFSFTVAGYDWANPAEATVFRLPMICVSNSWAFDRARLAPVLKDYEKYASRRQASYAGQAVHFAPSQSSGDTRLQCNSLTFFCEIPPATPSGDWSDFNETAARYYRQPFFFPTLQEAEVDIPAVQHMAGDAEKTSVSYPAYYLRHGFSPASDAAGPRNPGEVFLERVESAAERYLKFPGNKGGGFVVPNISISGVSRQMGAIAGNAEKVAKNVFDPTDFFKPLKDLEEALNPKLLGVIALGDVIAPLRDIRAELDKIPQLVLTQLHDISEWLKNALENEVFKAFKQYVTDLQAQLNTFEQNVVTTLKSKLGGDPKAKLQEIADSLGQSINTTFAAVRMLFFIQDPLAARLAGSGAGENLEAVARDLMQAIQVLQQNGQAIAQQDLNDIEQTFTVFAKRQFTAFRDKIGAIQTAIARAYSQLPTAEVSAAVAALLTDLGQIGDPTKVLGLVRQLPTDIEDLKAKAARLRTSLERLVSEMGSLTKPEILKKLLMQTVTDLQDTLKNELNVLRENVLTVVQNDTTNSNQFVAKAGSAFGEFGLLFLQPDRKIAIWDADFKVRRTPAVVEIQSLDPQTQTVTLKMQLPALKANDVVVPAEDLSLNHILAKVAWELQQYAQNPPYSSIADAVTALNSARDRVLALKQQLTTLVSDVHGMVNSTIASYQQQITDKFNQAISEAFQAIPAEVFDAIFALTSLQQGVASLLEQISRPVEIKVRYDFSPALHDAPSGSPIFLAHGKDKARATFQIGVELRKKIDPKDVTGAFTSDPEFNLSAKLTNFSVQLLPSVQFFTLQFADAAILVEGSQQPQVTVHLDPDEPIIFGDALSFISGFIKAVQKMGGDDKNGPYIRLYPWGVRAGYNFTAPDITAGGFNVHGLSLGAAVELSFENKPLRVRFHFAERAHPFMISSGIFGGGGYFLIDLGPDGVELLEIALEFGAYAEISIASLAHGNVHILGGIYYSSDGHSCRLTGFVDAGGCLNVIGLIDVNLDFYLGLSYTSGPNGGTVEGECTVTVEIGYAFFSITVHLTAHRTFSQSGPSMTSSERPATPAMDEAAAGLGVAPLALQSPSSIPAETCFPLRRLKNEDNWNNNYYAKFAEVSHS
jgi:hypothetical protein